MNGPANGPNNIRFGFGRAWISAHGWPVLAVLMLALIAAVQLYAGTRVERAVERLADATLVQQTARAAEHARLDGSIAIEHVRIQNDLNKTACVLAMTVDERTKFRKDYSAGAWTRWCPWVKD